MLLERSGRDDLPRPADWDLGLWSGGLLEDEDEHCYLPGDLEALLRGWALRVLNLDRSGPLGDGIPALLSVKELFLLSGT